MDIKRELDRLLSTGLRFTIELKGTDVIVLIGDYVRRGRPSTTVGSVEEAIDWLRRMTGLQAIH